MFDPTALTGRATCKWSPLRAADTPSGAAQAAAALAAAIPDKGVDGGMGFWTAQAELLLEGLLGTAALTASSMVDVAHWVLTKDMPVKANPGEVLAGLRRAALSNDAAIWERAAAAMLAMDAIWRLDERIRSSIYATVQTVVKTWLDPNVAASATLARTDEGFPLERYVDLEWLVSGDNTLYLVAPLAEQDRLAAVLGGLLGDLKDQAFARDVAGGSLAKPLLLMFDEAGNMPLRWLPKVASVCAGLGILLVTVWQSVSQIVEAYGRLADAVITNHGTKVIFAGVSDHATLEMVTRLLGDEGVPHASVSVDTGAGRRRSVSTSTQREALAPYHLLRQAHPGQAVLIHGTLPPAHLHARFWHSDAKLRKLNEPDVQAAEAVMAGLAPPAPAGQPAPTRSTRVIDQLRPGHRGSPPPGRVVPPAPSARPATLRPIGGDSPSPDSDRGLEGEATAVWVRGGRLDGHRDRRRKFRVVDAGSPPDDDADP